MKMVKVMMIAATMAGLFPVGGFARGESAPYPMREPQSGNQQPAVSRKLARFEATTNSLLKMEIWAAEIAGCGYRPPEWEIAVYWRLDEIASAVATNIWGGQNDGANAQAITARSKALEDFGKKEKRTIAIANHAPASICPGFVGSRLLAQLDRLAQQSIYLREK